MMMHVRYLLESTAQRAHSMLAVIIRIIGNIICFPNFLPFLQSPAFLKLEFVVLWGVCTHVFQTCLSISSEICCFILCFYFDDNLKIISNYILVPLYHKVLPHGFVVQVCACLLRKEFCFCSYGPMRNERRADNETWMTRSDQLKVNWGGIMLQQEGLSEF